MRDVYVAMFARYWGITETSETTDAKIRKMMKNHDSEEMFMVITDWVDEFLKNEDTDTCSEEFFDSKLEEYVKKEEEKR